MLTLSNCLKGCQYSSNKKSITPAYVLLKSCSNFCTLLNPFSYKLSKKWPDFINRKRISIANCIHNIFGESFLLNWLVLQFTSIVSYIAQQKSSKMCSCGKIKLNKKFRDKEIGKWYFIITTLNKAISLLLRPCFVNNSS